MTRERAYRLRALIEQAVVSLDDEAALEGVELFRHFDPNGHEYKAGDRFFYPEDNQLYRVRMDHTSQPSWTPTDAASLYEVVVVDEEAGTITNPIPYNGNMALEEGKYYAQDNVVYLCIRDTVNPVYNALRDLVGIYVEVAE